MNRETEEDTDLEALLLPGVPAAAIGKALAKASGDELGSGKFASPESSSALAVNAFGRFLEAPNNLPPLPGLEDLDWPATRLDVERQMRFPWRGGRHPWLDAALETRAALVGIESKRFEPFRDAKTVSLSEAYDRDVWGSGMDPWMEVRDSLRAGALSFTHLDAVQLVKHAFGLVTEGRRLGKTPVLFYIHAEPKRRAGRAIAPEAIALHREEIREFSSLVSGATVRLAASSYRDWLATWSGEAGDHAALLIDRFAP